MTRRAGLWTAVALLAAVTGGAFAYFIQKEKRRAEEETRRASTLRLIPNVVPRPWRWPTESEWIVHQVVRYVASWASLAGGQEAEVTKVRVRRQETPSGPGSFEVEISTGRGAQKLAVRPQTHVWDPAAYVDVARVLLAPTGATEAGEPAAGVAELLLVSDTSSLRLADTSLVAEMRRRPGDPRLHEQAALLWAAHALRETDGYFSDDRPFLAGLVAHLALSRALRATSAASHDGELAAAVLDALLVRQVEGMAALDRLEGAEPDAPTRAWMNAIRLRVTRDPRLIPEGPAPSRLQQLEGVRALYTSRNCRSAVERARSWGLRPAADWIRATVSGCSEPERSQLASDDFELQARDAARMLDLEPRSLPATVESLQSASAENTHQPAPPKSVVPAHLRADTGVRHLFSAIGVMIQNLGRLGLPSQIKMLSVATEPLRQSLTLRPLLELVLEDASQWRSRSTLPEDLCERLARLVADRPDLVTWWDRIARCRSQTLLRMVTEMQWSTSTNLPGTGRMPPSAWEASPRTYAGLRREAGRRAPWNQYHIQANLIAEYKGEPPSAAVLKAYEKLLDYDLYAMGAVVFELHDDDDQVQRLSERICDLDVEQCGNYAAYLAILGRDAPAERLWKRALAGARDQITLSNQLGGYVNLLLDRGETAEALRIARRAADVYSGGGLATLALAYERLGRFDDAAREYAKITRRYEDKVPENTFYVRHRQRYGGNAFGRETALAMAELFPKGLLRKALAVFQHEGHRGGVGLFQAQLTEPLRRAGLRQEDFLVALDGFAVENQTQMDAVLTFTDEPTLTAIVFRRPSFIEVKGRYHRWKYGLVTGKPPA